MGNLTFYSPSSDNLLQDTHSTSVKSQKFLQNVIKKVSSPSTNLTTVNSPKILNRRQTTSGDEPLRELSPYEPEPLMTTSTFPEEADTSIPKVQGHCNRSLDPSRISFYPNKNSSKTTLMQTGSLKDKSNGFYENAIVRERRAVDDSSLQKIYRSAHEFQSLKIGRDIHDDIAKRKLIDDRKNTTSKHLQVMRADVSHLYNPRVSKSISINNDMAFPEVKEQQRRRFVKLLENIVGQTKSLAESQVITEKSNNSGLGNQGSNISSSPLHDFKLLENNLKESTFLRSSTLQNRTNLHVSLQQDIKSSQSPFNRVTDEINEGNVVRKSRDCSKSPDYLQINRSDFDCSEGSPLYQLKKELPTVFSTVPSNRQEILTLGKWLSNSLKDIQEDKKYTQKEKFHKADEIYNITFNELIRQVSLDCIERGELLMIIWKAYLRLAEEIIEDIKLREEKAEEKGQKEVQKVHTMYDDILKQKETQMEELKQKLESTEKSRKELADTMKTVDAREASKIEEIAKLKEYITKLKKHAQALQVETHDLQYKYQRLQKELTQVEDDPLDEQNFIQQQATLRRKAEMELSISSDSEDDERGPGFGNAQQKVIEYAEKSIMYEHPNGFSEMEIQTDLWLMNEKYDKLLVSNETLEKVLFEEIAKAKLMKEAEMMENLADKPMLKRKSTKKLLDHNEKSIEKQLLQQEESVPTSRREEDYGIMDDEELLFVEGEEDEGQISDENDNDEIAETQNTEETVNISQLENKNLQKKASYYRKQTSVIEEVEEPLDSVRPVVMSPKGENSTKTPGEEIFEANQERKENNVEERIPTSPNQKLNKSKTKTLNRKGKASLIIKVDGKEDQPVKESPKTERISKGRTGLKKNTSLIINKEGKNSLMESPRGADLTSKSVSSNKKITSPKKELANLKENSKLKSPSKLNQSKKETQYSEKETLSSHKKLDTELSDFSEKIADFQKSHTNLKESSMSFGSNERGILKKKNTIISNTKTIDRLDPHTSPINKEGERMTPPTNNTPRSPSLCLPTISTPRYERTQEDEDRDEEFENYVDGVRKTHEKILEAEQEETKHDDEDEHNKGKVEKNEQMTMSVISIVGQKGDDPFQGEESPGNEDNEMERWPTSPGQNDTKKARTILKESSASLQKNLTKSQGNSPARKITFGKEPSAIMDDLEVEFDMKCEEESPTSKKDDVKIVRSMAAFKRAQTMIASSLVKMSNSDEDPKKIERYIGYQEQRIVKLMNMYKIEKQKQEDLNSVNKELEKRVSDDTSVIHNLQSLVEDLKRKLELTEQHRDKLGLILKGVEERNKQISIIEELRQPIAGVTGSMTSLDVSKISVKRFEGERFGSKKGKSIESLIMDGPVQTQQHKALSILNNVAVNARKNFIIERNNNPGHIAIVKLKANEKLMKTNDVLPLKSLLKQITAFYVEKIQMGKDNPLSKEQDMVTFVYKQFLNTYGFQQFALKKFTKFIISVKRNAGIPRINKFAKMLGLMEEDVNYTVDETKQFMNALEFLLTNTSFGTHYPNPDFEKRHFTPFLRALEYVRIFGERRMKPEDYNEWKKEVERYRMPDPTGRNLQGVLDLDEFLDKVATKFKILITEGKEAIETVFNAVDLNEKGYMNYLGFMSLLKSLESERYEEKRVEDLFINHCDVVIGDEIALSLGKFLSISFEFGLFSESKVNYFLNIQHEEDVERRFEDLRNRWENEKQNLTEMMNMLQNSAHRDIFKDWQDNINCIDKVLSNEDFIDKKAIVLSYRLLYLDLTNALKNSGSIL